MRKLDEVSEDVPSQIDDHLSIIGDSVDQVRASWSDCTNADASSGTSSGV